MGKRYLSRGLLFAFSDDLYYAYGEIGQSLQTFTVNSMIEEEEKENFVEIVINGQMYYTDFSCLEEIPKKSIKENAIVANATEEEMEKIRDQKKYCSKSMTHNKKIEQQSKKKSSLKSVGFVVRDHTAAHSQSIVVYQNKQELLLIDKKRYESDGVLDFHYLQLSQVTIISKIEVEDLRNILYRIRESYTHYLSEQEVDKLIKKLCNDDKK